MFLLQYIYHPSLLFSNWKALGTSLDVARILQLRIRSTIGDFSSEQLLHDPIRKLQWSGRKSEVQFLKVLKTP